MHCLFFSRIKQRHEEICQVEQINHLVYGHLVPGSSVSFVSQSPKNANCDLHLEVSVTFSHLKINSVKLCSLSMLRLSILPVPASV